MKKFKMKAKNGKMVKYEIFDVAYGVLFYRNKRMAGSMTLDEFEKRIKQSKVVLIIETKRSI